VCVCERERESVRVCGCAIDVICAFCQVCSDFYSTITCAGSYGVMVSTLDFDSEFKSQ